MNQSIRFSLEGPRVLIAGATGGLGGALVEELLKRPGGPLGLHGRSRPERVRVFQEGHSRRCRIFRGVLETQKQCHRLVDRFVEWAGGLDVLIQLTGGVDRPGDWRTMSEKSFQKDLRVNLMGPFFLAQRAVHHMRRGGQIVLMSTASARHGGGPTSLAYGSAKAGIECVVKGLARATAKQGIQVNAVAPGFIQTEFHSRIMRRSPKDLIQRAQKIPLGRAGTPTEVAQAILFLTSPAAGYMTGEVLTVSGGDWL